MKRTIPLAAMVGSMLCIGWMATRTLSAAPETWVGVISDSTCKGAHGEVEEEKCVESCLKKGDKLVFVRTPSSEVIPIANQDFAAIKRNIAVEVKVTGELKDGGLVISNVEKVKK
jgi:hypothetical protein